MPRILLLGSGSRGVKHHETGWKSWKLALAAKPRLHHLGRHPRRSLISKRLKPPHIRFTSKPRQLPLRIVTMPLLRRLDSGLFRQRSRQHTRRLPITQRIQRLHRPISLQQPSRLLNQPSGKHLRAALIQSLIQRRPRRIQPDPQEPKPRQRITPHHFAHRFPCRQTHLNRANQLRHIIRMNFRRPRRIKPRQQFVQPGAPALLRPQPQSFTQGLLPRRTRKQPFRQRTQIKSRTACHNRQAPAPGNLLERRARPLAVLARRKSLIRVRHINQVMRQPCTLFQRRLRRPQIHPAIHRHRVATDNLAAEPLTQRQRKRRLPAARRPQQYHNQRIRRPPSTYHRHHPGGKIHFGFV
jgi:hypothetical protein